MAEDTTLDRSLVPDVSMVRRIQPEAVVAVAAPAAQ